MMKGPRAHIFRFAEEWSEDSYALLHLGWKLFTESIFLILLVFVVSVVLSLSIADSIKAAFKLFEISITQPFIYAFLVLSVLLKSIGERLIGTRIQEEYVILDILTSVVFSVGGIILLYFGLGVMSEIFGGDPFVNQAQQFDDLAIAFVVTIPSTGFIMILAGLTLNGLSRFVLLFPKGFQALRDSIEEFKNFWRWLTQLNTLALSLIQVRRYADSRNIGFVNGLVDIFSRGLETIEPIDVNKETEPDRDNE